MFGVLVHLLYTRTSPNHRILKLGNIIIIKILTTFNKEFLPRIITGAINSEKNVYITKTRLYNFDPLKPHFYIVKLGFYRGIHYFSYFAQKHRLWYSLEPPRRGGSNKYPQSMFWAEIWKISEFLSENFHFFFFLVVKFSIYLNRRVFVMRGKYEISMGSNINAMAINWVQFEPTPVLTAASSPSEAGDITTAPLRLL